MVVGLATGGVLGPLGAGSGRLVPAAGADEATVTTAAPPTTDPTSTAPEPTGSTTTQPGSTPTDAVPGPDQSTTTTAPGTLPAGDGAEDDVGSAFGPQAPFNPASKQPQPAAIARAQHDQDVADAALVAAQGRLDQARQAIADEQDSLAGLAASQRRLLAAAEQAQTLLVERAVTLYMAGGGSSSVDLLGRANPSDIEIGMEMLDEVLDQLWGAWRLPGLARCTRILVAGAAGPGQPVAGPADRCPGRPDHGHRRRPGRPLAADDLSGRQPRPWRRASSSRCSDRPASSTRSATLRLSGTSEQHWHEGCDVMAAAGTPMVAVEDGC